MELDICSSAIMLAATPTGSIVMQLQLVRQVMSSSELFPASRPSGPDQKMGHADSQEVLPDMRSQDRVAQKVRLSQRNPTHTVRRCRCR